jgi:hypothetical protein
MVPDMPTTRRQEQVLWQGRHGIPKEHWLALDKEMAKTLQFQMAVLHDAFEDLGRSFWKALGWKGVLFFAALLPVLVFVADLNAH